jgi:Cytochrome P450
MFLIKHLLSQSVWEDAVPLSHLSISTALWLVFIVAIVHLLYVRYFHPLSSIPGPFLASITRLWLIQATLTLRRHSIEADLHEKYGSIVRISPNELSISDPIYVHELYGAHSQFAKSDWYSAVEPESKDAMNLLGESDMEKHRHQRRLIGPMFTTQAIKKHESLMDGPILRFVVKMREAASNPQDLCKWMNILALDLLTEVTFSESPNYIDAGDDAGNSQDIDAFWQQISWVGLIPRLWRAYVWLSKKLASAGLKLLPLKREASSLSIVKVCMESLCFNLS